MSVFTEYRDLLRATGGYIERDTASTFLRTHAKELAKTCHSEKCPNVMMDKIALSEQGFVTPLIYVHCRGCECKDMTPKIIEHQYKV